MPAILANHDVEAVSSGVRGGLEAEERDREDRPPFYLTATEVKLLGISGVSALTSRILCSS
jgi:PHS family inorganic phosphate transporter-like MFS transporter